MIRIASVAHYFQPLADGAVLPSLDDELKTLCRENFRRIDRFIQLALLGSARCVAGQTLQRDCAIYLGSGLGPIGNNIVTQEQLIRDREIPKPFNFINTLGSSAGFYVARNLGLSGQNFFISRRGESTAAVLSAALADLVAGDARQALVGVVEEATFPLAAHRLRQGLAADMPVAEGSHWLLLQAGGEIGGELQMQRFDSFAGLRGYLTPRWCSEDILCCGPEVKAEFADMLYHSLPNGVLPDPQQAFHDSQAAGWITEFVGSSDGGGNLYLVTGAETRGWVLFHCNA
jgi:hypothetical protein